MKVELKSYIKKLEKIIKDEKIDKNLKDEVLQEISFFQHERLVHLIVTFFTGISCILFLITTLFTDNIGILLLFILTLLLFVPYIFHYYYLENGVQRLYELYREIKNKSEK